MGEGLISQPSPFGRRLRSYWLQIPTTCNRRPIPQLEFGGSRWKMLMGDWPCVGPGSPSSITLVSLEAPKSTISLKDLGRSPGDGEEEAAYPNHK